MFVVSTGQGRGKSKEKGDGDVTESSSPSSGDWIMTEEDQSGRVPVRTTKELGRIKEEKADLLRQVQELTEKEEEIAGKPGAARSTEVLGSSIFGTRADVFADLLANRGPLTSIESRLAAEGNPPGEVWKNMAQAFGPRSGSAAARTSGPRTGAAKQPEEKLV